MGLLKSRFLGKKEVKNQKIQFESNPKNAMMWAA